MNGRMGPLKVIRDRAQDRTRPSPFRDVAARPTTPATRGLPPVAVGNGVAVGGKGVGSALTASFLGLYAGKPRVVGTQIANVPSIRLYSRLGFQLAKSQYVLHLHTGN